MLSQPMEMAPEGDGGAGLMNSMPITLQPVFIPRGGPNMMNSIGSRMPGSPPAGMGSSSASADWAFLLRSAAAMSQPSQGALGVAIDSLGHGSSSNAVHGDLAAAGMRSSPQFNSSPNLLYSPVSSAAPASGAFFNSMVELNANDMANSAATDPANSLVMHLSNGNNLASLSAAAAAQAVYGGDAGGVQTLYPSSSNDTLTIAANAARQAVQTQTLLQQQAAAVNSLSAGLGNMGLSPMAANGLGGTLEESLSGSLFAAAAAAAAANSAAASKPVSASLYIKVSTPRAIVHAVFGRSHAVMVQLLAGHMLLCCAWQGLFQPGSKFHGGCCGGFLVVFSCFCNALSLERHAKCEC